MTNPIDRERLLGKSESAIPADAQTPVARVASDQPADDQSGAKPAEGRARHPKHDDDDNTSKSDDRASDDDEHDGDDDAPDDEKHVGPLQKMRQHPIGVAVAAVILIAAIVGGVLYYMHARNFENTDDAFIDGRPVLISPQVTGYIISVNVTDNQIVKAGDLLAKIDPRDYQAAVDQAAAQIEQADATMRNLDAQINAQKSQIEQAVKQVAEAQATLNFAKDENTRYQDLVEKGAGTVQRAQQAASDFQSKQAALDAAVAAKTSAERQIAVLQAQKGVAAAQRDQMVAQKAQADANLSRTELRATVDGRVTRLTAAVGALATSAQSIMIVVPLDVWVTANFKEGQLRLMKVGQPVTISIDAFGRSYPGHVNSIQAGSGTAFSLLPAENATGNYVKVVQRVPVKITFDQRPDVELGPGMSVVPTVTVR